MRKIREGETCYAAGEIAVLYENRTGRYLTPVRVGMAAQGLGLDCIEISREPSRTVPVPNVQRKYSELDLPQLFARLDELEEKSRTATKPAKKPAASGPVLMRRIASGEICYSAAEIADLYHKHSGVELHPTNVGMAAARLQLDYLEFEAEDSPDGKPRKPQRKYSTVDLPLIFQQLDALVAQRAKYT